MAKVSLKTQTVLSGLIDEHSHVTFMRYMQSFHVKILHQGVKTTEDEMEVLTHEEFQEEAKELISQGVLERKHLSIYLRDANA